MPASRHIRKFSVTKRIFSFRYAIKGIYWFLAQQHNLLVHFLAAAIVTTAGFFFHLERWEWVAVILCMGAVIAAELFNSAIEILCDALIPERNQRAEIIKDVAAGAVLVAALAAVVIALIVFIPHIRSSL
jgi:diacylglycerol kinase (ATP)